MFMNYDQWDKKLKRILKLFKYSTQFYTTTKYDYEIIIFVKKDKIIYHLINESTTKKPKRVIH